MLKITGRQIRMARIALKWRVDDLAKESDVTWARLQTMERSDDLLEFSEKIQKIVNTFKKHKIEFVDESESYYSFIKIKK